MRPMIMPCRELYERFYDGFASHGEPNIPFDRTFLQSDPFYALLARLKQHIEEHQRDHWCALQLCFQNVLTILTCKLVLTAGRATVSKQWASETPDGFYICCRIQCSVCCKWRIVTYEVLQQVSKDTSWTCRQLRWVFPLSGPAKPSHTVPG